MDIIRLLCCICYFVQIGAISTNTHLDALKREVFKNPYKIEAHEHLIKTLMHEQQYAEAENYLNEALQLFNKPASLIGLKAALHVHNNQIEQATACYLELYKYNQESIALPYNIGWCLSVLHRHDIAIHYYLKALSLDPEYDFAHLGISKAYLAVGECQKAWPHFERRMAHYKKYVERINVAAMTLNDIIGKRVLVLTEWGLGDMIQYLRFTKELKKAGAAQVIVQAHEPLVPLFSMCDYIDAVITPQQIPPAHDIQIPMMSLTYLFNTSLETIPRDFPYLKARTDLIEAWKPLFKDKSKIHVGLCWGAKKIFLEDHPYTRRSIPLNMFAALAEIPNVIFYSLQKVYDTEQLQNLPEHFKVHDFGPNFDEQNGRFMDTAALLGGDETLDLIISVDTSVIHLAGNLAKKPVWVLLPYSAAWWWLYDRTDTVWYPTMRFFRQQRPLEWGPVFEDVKKALEQFVQERLTKNQ